jgi:hypothetical protein
MADRKSRKSEKASRRRNRFADAPASPRWSLGPAGPDDPLDLFRIGIFDNILASLERQPGVVNSAKATCDTIAADYHVVAG